MTGILCVHKPEGPTSFDVVARVRRMTGIRRVGHGGTLDPMATGVLPVFVGRATKLCDILPEQDKGYRAAFRLGLTTDTQDITGEVLSQSAVRCGKAEVLGLLPRFLGEQDQVPPMYSAVKVGGKKLYQLARQGREVERPPRRVSIRSITLEEADEAGGEYTLQVHCSKGTYIRTLCHDLGQALGCGAVLISLCRTHACGFALADCVTLAEASMLAEAGALTEKLLPCEIVFRDRPRLDLSDEEARRLRNGVRLDLERLSLRGDEGQVAVFSGGRFLGTALTWQVEGQLRLQKLFRLEETA